MDRLAGAPSAGLDRADAERIRLIYKDAWPGLVSSLATGVGLGLVLLAFGEVNRAITEIWIGLVALQALIRLVIILAYNRVEPPPGQWRPWAQAFSVGAVVGGITWGFGSMVLMDANHFDQQMLLVVVILGLIYGALPAFGGHLPAFLGFTVPAVGPTIVWSAFQHDWKHWTYAALGTLWIPVIAILALRYSRSVRQTLTLRYENLDLLEDLKRQKDLADQANIAKSRFLASASHDLRQPVHALGMFVGALRAQETSPQAARLINHIEGSVGALDSLFTSLLDISRLDAGVIEAQARPVALGPMLERICLDHEGEAWAKGVRLRLVAPRVHVRSDPVLLERILRNIVSNAVRYTQAGRVLVGARRRGDRLAIQVWDTGAGIAPEQREEIFQEFFQVANPGRDRTQGLGLGLAIVRRLTVLLDHPLSLRSEPGRGSVFSLSVPLAAPGLAAPAETEQKGGLAGGLILVIDDETAIQDAMRSLLESWGHQVIVAGSSAEMLDRIVSLDRAPDLIICDYRLGRENGIEVIERLQQEFNDDIPAMLITGDTAPDRLVEARESGFALLHKPLSQARLRAAMGAIARRPALEEVEV